jgi:DNA-binding response OmpR family regulator
MAEKILIVDDDLDTLRLVGLMLQRQGYEIVAASNGQQAISMAQSGAPDLILLDVMMPDLDGVEVTRRLRAHDDTKDVPIIMFTAKTQVEDKILGFEAGADDYLTKPTQPRELFAHVKAVLARSNKSKPPPVPTVERGRVIGVLAARGGQGVSSVVLNLGIALQGLTRKEVIVAEFRPGQGTISMELGYLHPEGLNRLLKGKTADITHQSIENELVSHPSGVRFLLASPQPRDAQYIAAVDNFEAIARYLPFIARYVVIDLGVSLTPIFEKVMKECDDLIIVVEPVPQTLMQSKAFVDDLIEKGCSQGKISIVLVNRIRSGMQLSWSQVQEQLERNIAVIFTPAPELAYQASMHNLPMVTQQPDSLTAQQFTKLAEHVAQKKIEVG